MAPLVPDPSLRHQTFPLTLQALSRLSLTPEFDYLPVSNARQLSLRLGPSLPALTAGQISAMGLMGKIFLHLIDLYGQSYRPGLFVDLDQYLSGQHGPSRIDSSLRLVLSRYPTTLTYYSPAAVSLYLLASRNDPPPRHQLYKSILLIMLAEKNPALRKFDGVFTDPGLFSARDYRLLRSLVETYFADQPLFGQSALSLLDLLNQPVRSCPDSIEGQLNYMLVHWSSWLGAGLFDELLRLLGTLKEEHKPGLAGSGPPENPLGFAVTSGQASPETVRFSADLDWMPNLVLLAKNVFVWLDQLSKKYQAPIFRLDQIPEDELQQLAEWGFSGLWLIGLWQRSSASQMIKQICGNPDAVPSAYSLYDYRIADVLGGDPAYQNLSARAAAYNIRLAADMVPNHMGVYSKWVVEHPDWFLSLPQSPFPAYSFQGPDLSEDSRVGIFIEDHYYTQDDAAVVFKRVDRGTGETRYIYHGNDGTSMPWNDTAQLDFLNPDAREAVIQTILHVARKFPVIRFDAAMTLAKKHYQRLWFPEPGAGGAIPTRSEHGLTKAAFDQAMPTEFWREVVDRVSREAPDTLLLAEAFWMMEGYFVRSLGMHRVYNSAFMHMLRDEHNQKFRELVINTLEFDPQILKRYVNFMNNPDEDTAIAQFGSNGKYFGVCTLMVTLPGLPMFGHGQIEGFAEKYGMEYQRAYHQESPNPSLVERHRREIFPLLHLRQVFSGVDNFRLYDLVTPSGDVNQDTIVYSNTRVNQRALVIYHNKWGSVAGKIHYSTPINNYSVSLLDGLGLTAATADYILFRDHITGLEYIRPYDDLLANGLSVDLGAYQYHVFLDFELVHEDPQGSYAKLNAQLSGKGTSRLQASLIEIKYDPLTSAIAALLNPERTPALQQDPATTPLLENTSVFFETFGGFFPAVATSLPPNILQQTKDNLRLMADPDLPDFLRSCSPSAAFWLLFIELAPHLADHDLQLLIDLTAAKLRLTHPDQEDVFRRNARLLFQLSETLPGLDLVPATIGRYWFSNDSTSQYLSLNHYQGITWYNKEAYQSLVDLTLSSLYLSHWLKHKSARKSSAALLVKLKRLKKQLISGMADSNFEADLLLMALERYS